MMCSIDKKTLLLDKQICHSTSRPRVHNNVFSTWNKLIILATSLEDAAICEPGLKNGTFSLTHCEFTKYVVTSVISLFANSSNFLGVGICSEVSASQHELSIFLKYRQYHHKEENLRTYPAGNCMFKVINRNTKNRCEICSKLTIKTPKRWRRLVMANDGANGVVLMSLLLTWNIFLTLL